MKKTINKSQLERLITECVMDTISEQRQPRRNNRQVMNEAQLQRYIGQIINEELENEGFMDYLRGAGKAFGNSVQNGTGRAKNYVGNKAQQIGQSVSNAYNNAKNYVGNKAQQAGQSIQNGMNNVRDYANSINQAGKNESAAADTQKIVQQIDSLYQKYGRQLTKSQQSSIRSAKSALNKLVVAFSDGSINAAE